MKAIILAAGVSSRLLPRTEVVPKCLLELHGKKLLDYQLASIGACGIDDVIIILGHMGDTIREAANGRAGFAEFPGFMETNNLYTLHHCRDLLDDDCLILFADVLLADGALRKLSESKEDFALLVDTTRVLPGTMRILTDDGGITDLGGHIPPEAGEGNFVGIAKFSARGAGALKHELEAMVDEGGHEQEYFVQALPRLAARGESIAPVEIGLAWLEIDDEADYLAALDRDFYVHAANPPPRA